MLTAGHLIGIFTQYILNVQRLGNLWNTLLYFTGFGTCDGKGQRDIFIGGQQQRVAAARAMVTNPAIVLADEPTGALDSNSSRMLLTMLTELNERLSATILMVTHDAFSASYCNRILFIKDGQVFNELHRGTDTRKEFFTKILEVVSVLGGEQSEHM